ncbi:CAP domain-containing protein [Lactobacillus delbrueckii]|uniref:CAP domain-containing protein n=1 Tax=Lactobacillus delbrueckii TaxID=1584 RepID=UPI00236483B5|nr:CAP domain-containing protein [Lactobacillus delbrueckii]MDD1331821.1 CAP domain-containing protein [Lactobacillus delbrueckii subsp. lactis]
MKMRHKPALLLLPVILLAVGSTAVQAAEFTPQEQAEVLRFQREYQALSKTVYTQQNIYASNPSLKKKFKAGSLKSSYINEQVAYINYYRDLFGLTAVKTTSHGNKNAQTTAAVMAAINANPFVNQHGLPNEKRPSYISKKNWFLAQDVSNSANLNFNASPQTAGDVVTDLLTDRYNLSGSDTGHRAWLLSTRLSKVSVGAAYGTNGYRYSVNQVLNVGDSARTASREMVAYPNAGVFPLELLNGQNIAWSLYFSNKVVTSTPKITVTDDDTGKTVTASQVANYSEYGFGNFQTVITYYPSKLQLTAGHKYTVRAGNLATYSFKLFKQSSSQTYSSKVSSSSTQSKNKVSQKDLQNKGLAKYLYKVGKNISTVKSKKITNAKAVKKTSKTKKTSKKTSKKSSKKSRKKSSKKAKAKSKKTSKKAAKKSNKKSSKKK